MDLIVLRSAPRRHSDEDSNSQRSSDKDSRLISMEEVRRRWQQKQAIRRAMLQYTPQPA